MPSCPTVVGVGLAGSTVDEGWNYYRGKTDQLIALAQAEAGELSNLELTAESQGNITFTVPEGLVLPLSMSAPVPPTLSYDSGNDEAKPQSPGFDVETASVKSAPAFSETAPAKDLPSAPVKPVVSLPDAPSQVDRDVASYTPPSDPEVQALLEINLPSAPSLDIPEWTAVAPSDSGILPPSAAFDYTDTAFSNTMLDTLQTKLSTWLTGSEATGLSDAIWNLIKSTQRDRDEKDYRVAKDKIIRTWSHRGFTRPGGPVAAELRGAREESWRKASETNNKLRTDQAKMEVDNMRFAFERGVALTQILAQIHDAEMNRAFAVAQYTYQSAIDLFNAKVAFYNMKLAAYQVEAQVFAERIRAALARIEVYKGQLEGQKLIGDINEQRVRQYVAEWEGVKAATQAYLAQIEGTKTQVEIDRQKIEAYRARVEAYGETLRGYASEVEAYRARVGAYGEEVNAYEAATRAHIALVEGVKSENEVNIANANMYNEASIAKARMFETEVKAWATGISAESDRMRAEAALFDGRARVYDTQGRIASLYTSAEIERYKAAVSHGQADANVKLAQLDLDVKQVQRLTELEVQSRIKAAEIYSQLSASSMSAVNLSAGISGSSSETQSCTTTHQYNY